MLFKITSCEYAAPAAAISFKQRSAAPSPHAVRGRSPHAARSASLKLFSGNDPQPAPQLIQTQSDKETMQAGEKLGKSLKAGKITGPVCLYGELGAGKTTFIRGLAKGLGISSRIQSPTFTYQRVHVGKTKLYHFDFYRLNKPDQMLINELNEAVGKQDGVIAIEWAEKVQDFLPEKRIDIKFKHLEGDLREINVKCKM